MFENQLCDNKIFHRRKKPFTNFFNYNVCSVLINLKKLDKINKLKFFSINSFNLFSIKLEDYGNQKGNLYSFIKKEIRNKYKVTKNYNIYLITSPRFLGYVFNPISVYFVEFNNLIEFVIYEVRNTHQEKHMYFKKIKFNKKTSHKINKILYVSPFLKMKMKYHFKIILMQKKIKILIKALNNKEELHTGMLLNLMKLDDKNLIKMSFKRAFYAQKIMIMIHYHAIKMILSKIKFNFKLKNIKNNFSYS